MRSEQFNSDERPEATDVFRKSVTEAKGIATGVIVFLVLAIVLGAMSSKGIHQYGCKYNWNAAIYFLANLGNGIVMGIPGLIGMYNMRDVTFKVA